MNSEKLAATAALSVLGDDGQNWIQGADAVTAEGKSVWWTDPAAVKFSLWGAVVASKINDESKESLLGYLRQFARNRGFSSLEKWNDMPARTFDDVKRMLMKIVESPHTK